MPKKFAGENSKAAESKARKLAKKADEEEKKQKEIEDEYWRDDDKHVNKKLQRKDDKERKKSEQLQRKKELQQLAEDEMNSLSKTSAKTQSTKVTRAQADLHKKTISETTQGVKKKEEEIEENLNVMKIEGEVARNVDEALVLLKSDQLDVDKHPEKRMRAAYLAYEQQQMPLLKAQNPELRLSQLKDMLRKEWSKSPDNPLVQRLLASQTSP